MSLLTGYMEDITSIKTVDAESLITEHLYIPEQDAFSINFQSAGYTSSLFIMNGSNILTNFALHFSLTALLLLACSFKKCLPKIVAQFQHYLFWNGSIRLFIEVYLDMVLFSLLNLYEMQKTEQPDTQAVFISYWVSISIMTICTCIPLILMAYYAKYRNNLSDTRLLAQTGTFIEGAKKKSASDFGPAVAIPMLLFTRSLVLSLSLVYLQDNYKLQLGISLVITMSMAMFISTWQPYENKFENQLQTFNQFITLSILYVMMCFTDFVPDPEIRYSLGYVQIVLVALMISATVLSMIFSGCYSLRLHLKRCINRWCRKRKAVNKSAPKTIEQRLDEIESELNKVINEPSEESKGEEEELSAIKHR